MKKILLLCSALLFTGGILRAQSLDEVLNNYYKALGGKEKLASLKSVYMEGVSVRPDGNEVTSKVWKEGGKQMRREVNSGMFSFTMILNDKEGWRSNMQNGGKLEPMAADMVASQQNELDIAGPLVDYTAKGHKLELQGQEDVNGKNCYKIKVTYASGKDATYYIAPDTWYLVRMKAKGMMRRGGPGGGGGAAPTEQEFIVDYSDFRKTDDGFIFPYQVTTAGMGGTTNFEKIEVNKPADAKLFKPE
jgi:outer membrane lipoprotein-sorting protein